MLVQDLIAVFTIFFVFHFSQQSEVIETIGFDKTFVGITFDHHISPLYPDPDAYSVKEIEVMLQVISKRFAHVIVPTGIEGPSDDSSTIQSAALIPIIAANQNKLMHLSKTEFIPFNIKLVIDLDAKTRMPDVLTRVDHALDLTLKANSIHPRTVSTLLLDIDNLDDEISQNVSIQVLSYIRNQNHTRNQEIQIGVWIIETDCRALRDIYAPRYTRNVLEYADLVIVSVFPAIRQVELGAQIASQSVIQYYTECKARLRRSFPNNLLISWSTWSSPNLAKEDDLNYTIMYWKFVSDWASKNKELLHIVEAFDTPWVDQDRPRSADSQRGWWRLDSTDMNTVTVNSFVEKVTLLNHSSDDLKPQDDNGAPVAESVSTIILIVIPVSFLLLLLIGVGIFILYRNMSNPKSQRLSKDDYEEFMEGSSISGVDGNDSEMLRLPYDKQQYELTKNSFTIDYTKLLGSGAFGCVYKGRIHNRSQECAFKLTKPSISVPTLKGLLSEIKLLCFLGNHENIVSLIGSYTAELNYGIVYVVTELCEGGSLEKFLRAQQPNYCNVTDESIRKSIDRGVAHIKTFEWERDMLRWSIEIATGLEYIASKNVVHADIAARNILLTSNLIAKIADFGLSRRMYDYTNYVKKQQEPLPWRWMSIEALRKLEFSEKSDIWAFGVTMWEIFSVGDVPYPGLSWSLGFVGELQKGLRLQRPHYSSEELYSLMLECWHPNPANRISFTKLKQTLMSLDTNRIDTVV